MDWVHRKHSGRRNFDDAHYGSYWNRVTSTSKHAWIQTKATKVRAQHPGAYGDELAFKHVASHYPIDGRPMTRRDALRLASYQSSPRALANALDPLMRRPQPWALSFSLAGPSGGHAIAAWRDGEGYRVFDPNLGEFRFDTPEEATWFITELWDGIYRARFGFGEIEASWIERPV